MSHESASVETNRPLEDWVINTDTCKIPSTIEDLKHVFLFTIRNKDAFNDNAMSFRDFKNDKEGVMWEILFHIFMRFGEEIKTKLEYAFLENAGIMEEEESVLNFYLE